METKIYTLEEQKEMFLQSLINKTGGRVTKVSDNSVLNGFAFGIASINQKSMKEIALLESELFPELAYGTYLDRIVKRSGVTDRQGAQGSSVYVRLVGDPGTLYMEGTVQFSSSSGLLFELEDDYEIGESGYGYAKLRSYDTGSGTNVPANSITEIINGPSGHRYVINEVGATGGVDIEDDQSVLNRLLENFNNFAFDTTSKLKAVFQILNPLVLDVKKLGIDSKNRVVLGIATVNGVALTAQELDFLMSKAPYYLSLREYPITNNLEKEPDVVLSNIPFTFVDMDFRVDLYNSVNTDDLRRDIQLEITKYLDFRNWPQGDPVQWEELLYIVRNQSGVKALPEQYFYPHDDLQIPEASYPRLRGFVMRDVTGNVIQDNLRAIVPYYYSYEYSENVYGQININYE